MSLRSGWKLHKFFFFFFFNVAEFADELHVKIIKKGWIKNEVLEFSEVVFEHIVHDSFLHLCWHGG